MLVGKNVIVAITGGIAAYKSAYLVRELISQQANVRVIMSQGAMQFITPLTLQALSGNPVHSQILDPAAEAGMGHIELARWADVVVIAPATANCIAKIAHGFADDLLSTVVLAADAPLVICPAMNKHMWANPMTQANLSRIRELRAHSAFICGPAAGEQACGDVGEGRMVEPEQIAEFIDFALHDKPLLGKKIVITAGATAEAIDPVRFISNHSSGKMGFALAKAAWLLGADVTVIAGLTSVAAPNHVQLIKVRSADEMLVAAMAASNEADWFIGCAAVADYKVANVAAQKLKKTTNDDGMTLQLVQNPDVIATIAESKLAKVVIGFAAETQNLEQFAQQKLHKKQLDFIVANEVGNQKAFNSDMNQVVLYGKNGTVTEFALQDKLALAHSLLIAIASNTK